ncbi:Tat pathway signal sequence domain protein [Kocuria rosea subsp. polaris]|uniref:Tat pathway signal sequence domain protein n=1 Tax=Kocuria rosea subsp. polaris TaxID=136273 RepID=A0A0W8I7N1_KOCRO|nr:alkaline phosphatase PhoX [Kocuria polaris]KUG55402.1 Tat pathway signal sequence domain protein [Kocuria polaris]
MRPPLSRRGFLGTGALGLAVAGLGGLASCGRTDHPTTRAAVGYGPLIADPDGVLALPSGFSYTVLARSGVSPTSDGTHPSDPDGMGVFGGPGGGTVLICNHENNGTEPHAVPTVEGLVYDPGASGGTSTLVVDADGRRTSQYTSLAGTVNNCAGGVTPWGTWLSCEETSARAGDDGLTLDHGYVFEVDPDSREANLGRSPVPLKFLGRYSHEAVAVDPSTTRIYLTEDAGDPSGLYLRWTPPSGFVPGRHALRELAESEGGDVAGRLQAMRCLAEGTVVRDLAEATDVGTRYDVEWIDVPDRDGQDESVRRQFDDDAVTRAHKLEGQWWNDDGVYFVSSYAEAPDGPEGDGGTGRTPDRHVHNGQVWFHDPAAGTVVLTVLFGVREDPDLEMRFERPDNITISPQGGLVLAEDGNGTSHLVGVTERGRAYALARNDLDDSEFCGPVFSQDGVHLFVNLQQAGLTLAITGPWTSPSHQPAG